MDRATARKRALDYAESASLAHKKLKDSLYHYAEEGKALVEQATIDASLSQVWSALALTLPEVEPLRCYSCDHEETEHEAGGCLKRVDLARIQSTADPRLMQCACAVSATAIRMVRNA